MEGLRRVVGRVSGSTRSRNSTTPPGKPCDLRRRLADTRRPDQEAVDDWSQGVPPACIRELAAYWRDGYDRRGAEARSGICRA
ncbi:epoxide hydrolase N-terminal domain-containing protein [Streptomyces sp. enrichment culture]|uniref:epoxide hydrolase N-terminal domain-containing protein n=1 Tax=Streptomyces sp. UNC401CLCol TaxID=1449077 RepID=UPI000996A26E